MLFLSSLGPTGQVNSIKIFFLFRVHLFKECLSQRNSRFLYIVAVIVFLSVELVVDLGDIFS